MHPHPVALLRSGDHLHRGTEVRDIQFTAQPFRQRRVQEIDNQPLALLAQVNSDLAIGKIDHNTPCAIRTATEIDVTQRQCLVITILGKQRSNPRCRRCTRSAGYRIQNDQQHLALQFSLVRSRLLQIQYKAGTLATFNDVDGFQVSLVDIHQGLAQGVRCIRDIQGDARRRLDCKTRGKHTQRLRQLDTNNLRTALQCTCNRLDFILRPRRKRHCTQGK